MKLLVTNDDGVASPGLWALADGLRQAGHEVVVVAPADERSGAGAAIGHIVPGQGVAVAPVERDGWAKAAWAVDGAPALCVLLALRLGAFGDGFDAVVSGINPGWNTGRGVIHSGTVGAVLTGGNAGLPGVAVSIEAATEQVGQVGLVPGVPEHWGSAVTLAVAAVGWLAAQPGVPEGAMPLMLNLNVPNRPLGEVPAVRTAGLGRSAASGIRHQRADVGVDGRLRLELGPPTFTPVAGSDNALLPEGFATVTVLTGIGDAPAAGAGVVEVLGDLVGGPVARL
ncbi:MAG: 5'/3'-nucleotidase SurE [Acidimicrobiales bacterium]